ncbi:hypothetical protein HBN50_04430 [Halobacteriovorax sp. GB3]|uniref:hypothetical protein n=1 Tax=Halobacteriovorax sp. GB3 TaxID=2719615 RepID=UPI00235ED752|nr:hypothetical protein [Halobacteriovorax sp. GB3]MDD0852329.1 hypothetical protein [Halobacteriovorax sp. GB3]
MRQKGIFTQLSFIALLLVAVGVSSCLPTTPSSKRSTETSEQQGSTDDTVETPDFSDSVNSLSNQDQTSNNTFSLSLSETRNFFLRGKQVDYFVRNNPDTIQCFVAYIPTGSTNPLVVMAARPKYITNLGTNQREYYYSMSPDDQETNQTFCLKTGIVTALNALYSTTPVYRLQDVCTNCQTSTLTSNSILLYSYAGAKIENITLTNLRLKIQTTSLPTDSVSCLIEDNCQTLGYDCCIQGQCVNDKTLKSSVDTSTPEFLQALFSISQNPNNISNYPNFYNLCGTTTPGDDDDTSDDEDPDELAQDRLEMLEELYQCTTPQVGEMSICTMRFTNASADSDKKFYTNPDDRSFKTYVSTNTTSVTEVLYQGKTLFSSTQAANGVTIASGNDDLINSQELTLTQAKDSTIKDDTLVVRYMVDGSCQKINDALARCQKTYVQGQNLGIVTDHFPESNDFKLPIYADNSSLIEVRVDGTLQQSGNQYTLIIGSPSIVRFNGTGLKVFNQQEVVIDYYVDLTVPTNQGIIGLKQQALEQIDSFCSCTDLQCSLKPVYKNNNESLGIITDYICTQPDNSNPSPMQEVVNVDTRSAPHRYYDISGVARENLLLADIQSNETLAQEGEAFEYTNGSKFLPNNTTKYIGFNEIYGSFSYRTLTGLPAHVVDVEKGTSYDIIVGNATFSNCTTCGNDYSATLADLFPQSFNGYGGGYVPNETETSRSATETYRADDLIFGRACFVPATMIPWSHTTMSDSRIQRQSRLAAQHFYFANGYQRDWYGFDYGSLIGSFDGVRWFAIGNARRIEATTNKLYLAINSFFSDLTVQSSFQVMIKDSIISDPSTTMPTTDYETTGAQCQAQHSCNNDSDCSAKLGWEYVCESVSDIQSFYPRFSNNAIEVPQDQVLEKLLLLNGSYGGDSLKRCVYRGRGAPCQADYTGQNAASTFNKTAKSRLLGCAPNYYCQEFYADGQYQKKFNNKVARWPYSVVEQNDSSDVAETTLSSFGKGARILGRPYKDQGDEQVNTYANGNLINNAVNGICLPGRSPGLSTDTLASTNDNVPTDASNGDKVIGIGVTQSGSIQRADYLSMCANFDQSNNLLNFQETSYNQALNSAQITNIAASQSMPTNSLALIQSISGQKILDDFNNNQITSLALQENRCLRAPGATCHTNLDCAANDFISNAALTIDPTTTTSLNPYEIKFWQETLICSQPNSPGAEGFDQSLNRCCRAPGKEMSIPSVADNDTSIDITSIPGLNIDLNNSSRYSRNAVSHYKRQTDPSNYPSMQVARDNKCDSGCLDVSTVKKQFNTIDETAGRTCCSENWIRNFDTSIGGGHEWGPDKMQNFDKSSLRCYNWAPNPGSGDTSKFNCSGSDAITDPDCFARSIAENEANEVLKWLGTMELVGIPQVAIKSETFEELNCSVQPTNSRLAGTAPPAAFVDFTKSKEYSDGAERYYSANYTNEANTNFISDVKKVFSADSFSCCQPAGTEMPAGSDENLCCTGHIDPQTNKCALKNYSNVSVYLNRYVSSEAKDLNSAQFDETTGFINSVSTTLSLACQIDACESGVYGYGLAYGKYKVAGKTNENDPTISRFIDGNGTENNDKGQAQFFDEGLRWNNHLYCIPIDFQDQADVDTSFLQVFTCN